MEYFCFINFFSIDKLKLGFQTGAFLNEICWDDFGSYTMTKERQQDCGLIYNVVCRAHDGSCLVRVQVRSDINLSNIFQSSIICVDKRVSF